MKVKIDVGCLEPMFFVGSRYGEDVEVSAAKLEQWERIKKDFDKMQMEMAKLYDEA